MSSKNASLNCTSSPWVLKSNSDISGIGILTGFGATAYLTLLLCVAYCLVDEKPASNPVDQYCIDGFYRLSNMSRPSEKWTKALEAAVLTFSDQQVVTGIAILISGYSQLRYGLAVYYWQLTVDLAWFSSVTHLTTLTCLRFYFQQRRGLKFLRLICMAVMAGMLSCAVASTGFLGGDNLFSYDYPAWCLFNRKSMKTYPAVGKDLYYNKVYVVLVLLFLFVSYCSRIIQLFPSSGLDELRKSGYIGLSALAGKWLLKCKNRALGESYRNCWALVYTLTMTIYCIFKAAADLYSSMLWEITWLATALAWGTIRIIMDRDVNFDFQASDPGPKSDYATFSNYTLSQDVTSAVLEDDVWGYGQVITVALLLVPLFSFSESIYESVMMDRKESRQLPTSASTQPESNPGSSSVEPWTNLYDCEWFRSLVWLIYLPSLAIAANILWIFPLGDGSYDLKENIKYFIGSYSAWFGFDFAVLLLFTITSLSLCHAEDNSEFRWTWRATTRSNGDRSKLIRRIIILNILLLVLAASSASFGWAVPQLDINPVSY